jgi:hypothetical protein
MAHRAPFKRIMAQKEELRHRFVTGVEAPKAAAQANYFPAQN